MTHENYPRHTEAFEVVLLRRIASEFTSLPSDYKRVHVEATDPIAAMTCEEISEYASNYRPIAATKPGVLTEAEILARRRELEGPVVEKSKIGSHEA
jgi:hypothetical protein